MYLEVKRPTLGVNPMCEPTFRFKKIGKGFLLACVIQATMSLFYETALLSVKGCAFFASVSPPQARFFGISRFATAPVCILMRHQGLKFDPENGEFLRPTHLYFWPFSGSKFYFEQFLLLLCSFLENLEKFSGPNAWFSSQSK